MKRAILIKDDHDVLYDTITDEVVFRRWIEGKEEVVRVSFDRILEARAASGRALAKSKS